MTWYRNFLLFFTCFLFFTCSFLVSLQLQKFQSQLRKCTRKHNLNIYVSWVFLDAVSTYNILVVINPHFDLFLKFISLYVSSSLYFSLSHVEFISCFSYCFSLFYQFFISFSHINRFHYFPFFQIYHVITNSCCVILCWQYGIVTVFVLYLYFL